jgi:hypothetical protein
MTVDALKIQYLNLNNAVPAAKHAAFVTYCREAVALVENSALTIDQAAYHICGTLSANVGDALTEEDRAITDIACTLELPAAQRDRFVGDWDKLIVLVKAFR